MGPPLTSAAALGTSVVGISHRRIAAAPPCVRPRQATGITSGIRPPSSAARGARDRSSIGPEHDARSSGGMEARGGSMRAHAGSTGDMPSSSGAPAAFTAAAATKDGQPPFRVLCLSNGHGEDTIAVSVLQALAELSEARGLNLRIEALPLVGLGKAYLSAGVPIVGEVKQMPSGGFVYMDRKQLIGDVQSGLIELTKKQWGACRAWAAEVEEAGGRGGLLLVGDVLPLALARYAAVPPGGGAAAPFAFVGCAKSQFYLEDGSGGWFPNARDPVETWLSPKCVYLPWERALMAGSRCRLIAPRDTLTARVLQEELPNGAGARVVDLGNPMMDGLEPSGALDVVAKAHPGARRVVILPGSRAPEVYANFVLLLRAAEAAAGASPEPLLFLAPCVPSLGLSEFEGALAKLGWRAGGAGGEGGGAAKLYRSPAGRASLAVFPGCFSDAVGHAEVGLAMAGTATEQLVGLGRPAVTVGGAGPQFTDKFAEAQTRLLGRESVFLCEQGPEAAGAEVARLLGPGAAGDRGRCVANGRYRMGEPGASARIAAAVCEALGIV